MPNFTEQEMKVILAKARLLECVNYSTVGNNSMWFLDKKHQLRMVARPGYPMWLADKNNLIKTGHTKLHTVANLRKRYES